jgi:MFS family permease
LARDKRWVDYLTINIYWFAITARSQVLAALIIPLLVQHFVGDAAKGTYVGQIRLWALMTAILVQSLMGLLSDRSTLRWGRRRPFIAVGTLGQVLVLCLIGFTAGMSGISGYWTLFALYILSMVASDTAHGAMQGLIPDLVPVSKRGLASGVKALFELPLPLIFVSLVIGNLVSAGNLWGALGALMAVLIVCMLITMLVREVPLKQVPFAIDWQPFLRLLLMTGAFTLIILVVGRGVRLAQRASHGVSGDAARTLTVLAGLLGMSLAIALGVWLSIRIGVGRDARKHSSYTWWVMNRLAFLVAVSNLGGFLLFFLQERFLNLPGGKAAAPAATAVMVVGIAILLAALPGGWLADRVGKRLLLAGAGLLAAVGTFLLVLVSNMTVIYVSAGLIGAAAGLFYSVNWALGTEIVPPQEAGRYLGLSNLAGAGAGAIGAYIGGPIADSVGYVLLYTIYGLLFLLSTLMLLGIHEKPRAAGGA